ncbi:MAG TPA: hypothetical protein VF444_02785 [Pseudonocardiaceae bacterium]
MSAPETPDTTFDRADWMRLLGAQLREARERRGWTRRQVKVLLVNQAGPDRHDDGPRGD